MEDPAELTELASWNEDPTTVGALTAALGRLWQEAGRQLPASAPASQGDSGGIIRTRVVNFVAYADSEGVRERVSSVLTHLAGTHPSRSLLLLAEPRKTEPSLGASMQAYCHTAGAKAHRLCFDQVSLNARGPAAERLPGIVTRLLIPDLPSLLWWPGDPLLDSPPFARVAAVCDVVIVDSSEFTQPSAGLHSLARLARSSRAGLHIADLNWDRLTEWREIVAQFFDTTALRRHLRQIYTVEIGFAADPYRQGASAQALLFAGWLASRLGWKGLAPSTETALRYQSSGGTVEVRLNGQPAGQADAGALVSLRIESDTEGQRSRFSASISDENLGTTELDLGGKVVSRRFVLDRKSEHRLLGEEIEAIGSDCALEDALDAVAAIPQP
jgi:glucose-6-phosphate dehydrogenase assembly protein OpcA